MSFNERLQEQKKRLLLDDTKNILLFLWSGPAESVKGGKRGQRKPVKEMGEAVS